MKPLAPDESRQAVASLAGYSYQIWRSVLAWLLLADDEALDLEGNEDIDVVKPNDEATTIQVKNTAGSGALTLRSPDVVDAINNYWSAKNRNPSIRLRYRFLCTSGITLEKGGGLDGQPGLSIWQVARRKSSQNEDQVRVESIRKFILGIDGIDPSLKVWLRAASTEDVLTDLIVPIDWDFGADGSEAIRELIDDRLVLLGEKFGVLPKEAVRMRHKLLETALATATNKTNRRLLRVDLLKVFEEGTTRQVPASTALAMASQSDGLSSLGWQATRASDDSTRLIAAVRHTQPQPYGTYLSRAEIVTKIVDTASRAGFVYVTGSTGMGKSTLVQLAAMRTTPPPLWIDLRDLGSLAPVVVRLATRKLLDSRASRSLVLDDLAFDGDSRALQDAVAEAITAVAAIGGVVFASGAARLPAALRLRLRILDESSIESLPLVDSEIEELLALYGCPAGDLRARWARVVRLQTTGHPQLVVARIQTLHSKQFPSLSTADLEVVPRDVMEVRAEARGLIRELPEADRDLLYRLSLTTGRFRRDVATKIAAEKPEIPHPGDALDSLVGPWIERIEENRYRISPLISGAGSSAYGDKWAERMHVAMAKAMFQESLSVDEVSNIFYHAVLGRSVAMLRRMCFGLISGTRDLAPIAEWLNWLLYIDADDAPNPVTTVFGDRFILRMVQFRIAAYGTSAQALNAASALERHTRLTSKSDLAAKLARAVALGSMLTKVEVRLSPTAVVQYLTEFAQLLDQVPELAKAAPDSPAELAGWAGKFDEAWLAPVSMHGRVDSAQTLKELFDALEMVPREMRARLLGRLVRDASLAQHVIDAVWLGELRQTAPEWGLLLDVLQRALSQSKSWEAHGIAIAIATTIVRSLNENLKRHDEALEFGKQALSDLGNDPRLLDAIADVFDWIGNPEEALNLRRRAIAIWQPSEHDRLGPVIGRRKAAISAGQAGSWKVAQELFSNAAEMLSGSMQYLEAGLLADAGHAAVRNADKPAGVRLILRSLDLLRTVPNTPDKPKEFRTHKIIGQLTSWLASTSDPRKSETWEPQIGASSSFDVEEGILKLPMTPVDYSLINLGSYSLGIMSEIPELRLRLQELRASPFSIVRFMQRGMEANLAVIENNLAELPAIVEALAREYIFLRELESAGKVSVWHQSDPIAAASTDHEEEYKLLMGYTLSGLVVSSAITGSLNPPANWKSLIQSTDDSVLKQWFALLDRLPGLTPTELSAMMTKDATAYEMGGLALAAAVHPDASLNQTLVAHVRLLSALEETRLVWISEPYLAQIIARRWINLGSRGFALNNPRLTQAPLLAACADEREGRKKIAAILKAAAVATATVFPIWVRDLLNRAEIGVVRPKT
jgi:tetratricopeptide (TPR) repeat protein